MESAHAFLAPSSAAMWGPGGCPGYPTMAAKYPEDGERPEAREGTAAHHYLAEALMGRDLPQVGDLAPNGHPITQEMIDCAQGLIDDVFAFDLDRPLQVEQRIYMPSVHPSLNWGTADAFGINLEHKTVYIWDYKYGHRYVDPFENWQLVDYIAGVFRHFSVIPTDEWRIRAVVYQPRCYHSGGTLKVWNTTGARFLDLIGKLALAAAEAGQPDAPLHTGDYCNDCSARHACPALLRAGGPALDLSMRTTPHDMAPEAMALELSYIKTALSRLEALESGLEAQVMAAIRSGKRVPFFKIGHTEGREGWTVPAEEVFSLGDMFGKDLRKLPEPITPNQARKLGVDGTVISAYSTRSPGKAKLEPFDDNSARKAFT